MLLLDEPTNHLDIATRERLEETLSGYPGTLIVATHDRYLVNRLATRVIEVSNGGIQAYMGTYADYLRAKSAAGSVVGTALSATAPAVVRPRAPAVSGEQDPAARRRLAADLREAERQVTHAEDRLRAVEAALSDPANYQGELAALGHEHATLQQEVERLTTRWTELAELDSRTQV
jgi:ATP-binding cassette subfamily F protein 3